MRRSMVNTSAATLPILTAGHNLLAEIGPAANIIFGKFRLAVRSVVQRVLVDPAVELGAKLRFCVS
jgi:hypothetical protein